MCLIVFAWQHNARYPLILAANRDEFHNRPTEAAQWWSANGILSGRDLRAGGAWLGVARDGRFATVTNFREGKQRAARSSRGQLVTDFQHTEETTQGVPGEGTIALQIHPGGDWVEGNKARFRNIRIKTLP